MKRSWLLILLLIILITSWGTASWGLTESSEARYAEISREMFRSRDYINPTLLGIKHFHKPPLTYYITCAGYAIFGVNEIGARFFLMIALLLQLYLVYNIARMLYKDTKVATAAMLLYASYPLTLIASKNLTTDCYLTTFIFAGIYFFLLYRHTERKSWLYFFYLSCALAFLTKGPVGIMPQALFAIIWGIIFKPKRNISIHNFFALLVGLALAFSWYIVLLFQNPGSLNYFIGHQVIDRVASDDFDRSKPFWYYFAFMPLLGLPGILLVADYIFRNVRKRRFTNPVNKLLVFTTAICLLVFSLSSSKLVLYVLPLYGFIAMLSARHLLFLPAATYRKIFNIIILFFLLILLSALTGSALNTTVIFPPMTTVSISVTGIVVLLWFVKGGRDQGLLQLPFCAAAGMFIIMLMLSPLMKANELMINSVKPLAEVIRNDLHGAETVLVYNNLLPSLEFYLDKKIITIYNGNSKALRETQFENADRSYGAFYYRLPADSAALKLFVKATDHLLVANNQTGLPDSLSWLKKHNSNQVVAGKWIIYY